MFAVSRQPYGVVQCVISVSRDVSTISTRQQLDAFSVGQLTDEGDHR